MRTLVIEGPGRLALREVEPPACDDECRVRVTLAGICGTDLQLLEGYAGFSGTPGHEFVGVVEWAPPRDAAWLGRRVVGEINVGCGACGSCASGVKEHCQRRTVVGIRGRPGAFADLLCLPAAHFHPVPDALDDEAAVFVEPTAAACRILEQVSIDRATRVAVLGDGRLGLIVAQVLGTAAADVLVAGRHDGKLAVAAGLGLRVARIDALDPGAPRFDVVVDATGRPSGLTAALGMVRPRGIVVMKSTFHGEAPVATWPMVVNEVTLVGSRCGPFDRALALLSSGAVRVPPLISRVASLEDHESAFAEARQGLKVLFAIHPHRGSGVQ